jgi:hypothetical protein
MVIVLSFKHLQTLACRPLASQLQGTGSVKRGNDAAASHFVLAASSSASSETVKVRISSSVWPEADQRQMNKAAN